MKVTINYKTKYGKYKQVTKEFNDEQHYNNWWKKFSIHNKILGTKEL